MPAKTFEQTTRELCEEILSEPRPELLPDKIIRHLAQTYHVQGSTLWLTEETGVAGEKRLRLAAADGNAIRLLTAENGGPAVYNFGEGLTGDIALRRQTVNITGYGDFAKCQHARKYDYVTYPNNDAEKNCRCVLGVPLSLKSISETENTAKAPWRVIGVLKLENITASLEHPEGYFTKRDVEEVEAYAAVLAVALEKAQMRADSIRIGAGLLDVSRNLLAELGESPNFDEIVKQTANAISAEACSLWLRSGMQLRLRAAYGCRCAKEEVPPYSLQTANQPPTDGVADDQQAARFKGVGLTVYVGQSGMPLNLRTAEEVRRHFAWKGANDQLMWRKEHGNACYSLVAIPLIDKEINDLKGVFKIENKLPTLFQLQSYFTKDDQQLLTTLGNSISLSLVIYERIERLRRLERLVGDVRFLYDIDEAMYFILTGLTHRDGLQYNRAMLFLFDPLRPSKLVCRYAIGQVEPAHWQTEMDRTKDEGPLDLDVLLEEFRRNKDSPRTNPMLERWRGKEIDVAEHGTQVIAQYAAKPSSDSLIEYSSAKFLSGGLGRSDILSNFAWGDFVLIPIAFEKQLKGIIYADNRFTGNRVNRFECQMLDLFGGMAAAIIQASGVPDKLKKERDQAWESFSRPAAHRIGTEIGIIDGEALFYLMRELDSAPKVSKGPSKGRIQVDGEVVRKRLEVVRQAVNRLRLAARDYQRLSFVESESMEDFNLCELIHLAVEQTTSKFEDIRVSVSCPTSPAMVRATRGGITYIIEELLINAWKEVHFAVTERGTQKMNEISVLIEIRLEQNRVVCLVADNGNGIPPYILPHLFQQPKSGRPGGTGLGLFLCRQIAARNNGTIELWTEENPQGFKGASFRITLPIAHRVGGLQAGRYILLVEDNPISRAHLVQLLRENGFTCETVRNEDEALEHVQQRQAHVQLIVADINLGEAGGQVNGAIILAERMAAEKLGIPIILMSQDPWYYLPARGSQKLAEIKREYGIHAVLERLNPTFRDELLASVRSVLHGQ